MKRLLLFSFALLTGISGFSQKTVTLPASQRKPLSHSVYDSWKEILYKSISPDGNYAAYTINPQDGDGRVVFYHLKTNNQDSLKRASDILFTFDSQQAIFKIKPQQRLVKDLRRLKKKKEDMPKDSLGIYSFGTRKTEKIPDVKSYKLPEKAGGWLAYPLDAKKEVKAKSDPAKTEEKKPAKKKKANTD